MNLMEHVKIELYKVFCQDLLKAGDGTQAIMDVEYLKYISKMLPLIISVRKKPIELHLALESALLSKCFAFDPINYCC